MEESSSAPTAALTDLPKAWLYRLSTKLTPQDASRLRSTCTLLLEVIDATWEPEDVLIPPHRRSMPLTLEQVQAQMPWKEEWIEKAKQLAAERVERAKQPPKPNRRWPDNNSTDINFSDIFPNSTPYNILGWSLNGMGNHQEEDEEQDEEEPEFSWNEHGRDKHYLSIFGPALTRLTANQAINVLRGQRMYTCLEIGIEDEQLSQYSMVLEKLFRLDWLTFDDRTTSETWPPEYRSLDSSRTTAGGYDEFCGRYKKSPELWAAVTASCGSAYAEDMWYAGHRDNEVSVSADDLLFKSDSCRRVTEAEKQEFLAFAAPEDADRFDTYLRWGRYQTPLYAFLMPSWYRHTGRVKEAAALATSSAAPV